MVFPLFHSLFLPSSLPPYQDVCHLDTNEVVGGNTAPSEVFSSLCIAPRDAFSQQIYYGNITEFDVVIHSFIQEVY